MHSFSAPFVHAAFLDSHKHFAKRVLHLSIRSDGTTPTHAGREGLVDRRTPRYGSLARSGSGAVAEWFYPRCPCTMVPPQR
jgi:hypothetical protein